MQRTVFNEEHEDFRKVIRSFIEAEVVPNFSDWEREGLMTTCSMQGPSD